VTRHFENGNWKTPIWKNGQLPNRQLPNRQFENRQLENDIWQIKNVQHGLLRLACGLVQKSLL